MGLIRSMRRARLGRWLMSVILSLVATGAWSLATGLAAPSSKVPAIVDESIFSSASNGPEVATGALADRSGRATAGTVVALAWPTEAVNKKFKVGDRIPTPTVGWGRAGSDGSFSLKLNSARITTDYVDGSGQLDLVLVAFDGSSQTQWGMSAHLDSAQPKEHVDMRMTDPIAGGPSGGVAFGQPVSAVAGCYYVLKATYNAWDNVAESYPYYYSTTSSFSIGYSHTMTLGAATSASGNYGTWSAGGGYAVTSGVSFSWSASNADRVYQVQTQYGKYQAICLPWLVKPIGPTGGARTVSSGWLDMCGYAVAVGAGLTWTRNQSSGYHFSESWGVDISPWIGIDLSVDTAYASDRSLTYNFQRSSKLCGNNNYPASAGRIGENPYA